MDNSTLYYDAQYAQSDLANGYAELASAALLFYDIILTTGDEINFIWRKKVGLGSVLYLSARYGTQLQLIMDTVESIGNVSDTVFYVSGLISTFCFLLYVIGASGISCGRAYAVSSGNRLVMVVCVVLYASFIGINLPQFGISTYSEVGEVTWNQLFIASLVIDMILDAFVLGTTIYYTLRLRRSLKKTLFHRPQSTTELLTQQGALRFLIVFIWSLELSFLASISTSLYAGIDTDLYNPISSILIYRFFLQLREYSYGHAEYATKQSRPPSTMRFAEIPQYLSHAIINELGDGDLYRCAEEDIHADEKKCVLSGIYDKV
ncbi:hypothetical protein M422DRAFT_778536 [Sphaerobolus stellatus SS14]|uniref:DUF6533 domain-containing protein n=1 Tax=Sphaerobolus stellatus (strain SS14) TaxID=990650 RepID=A0A0C9VGX7_SPHS4|nr:hypothetical protein M422DRAFT_778536 [Sphaerobolus stellatus SS14]